MKLVLLYLMNHWFPLLAVAGVLGRSLGPAVTPWLTKRAPRVLHLADAVMRLPDLVPAAQALFRFIVGAPWVPGNQSLLRVAPAPVPPPVPRGAAGFAEWPIVLAIALFVAGLFLATSVQGCSAPQQRHDATAAVVTAGGIVSGLYTASRVSYHVGTDALRARVQGPAYAAAVAPLNATYRARTRALGSLDSCVYSGAEIIDNASDPNVGLASSASASQVIDCINAALPELTSGDVLPAIQIPPQLLQFVAVLDGFANGAGLNTTSDAGGQ